MRQVDSATVAAQPVPAGFFGKLTKYIDNITTWVMQIFEWNNPILMLFIVYEVLMRYLFNSPTIWGMDMQTFLSAGGRVIGLGYATMVHTHIAMDLFTGNLSFRKAKALNIFCLVVFQLPLLTALVYMDYIRTLEAFKYHEYIQSVWRPEISPIRTFILGAYLVLTMQVCAEIIKELISLQRGSDIWLRQR